jgi:hypothetical protein
MPSSGNARPGEVARRYILCYLSPPCRTCPGPRCWCACSCWRPAAATPRTPTGEPVARARGPEARKRRVAPSAPGAAARGPAGRKRAAAPSVRGASRKAEDGQGGRAVRVSRGGPPAGKVAVDAAATWEQADAAVRVVKPVNPATPAPPPSPRACAPAREPLALSAAPTPAISATCSAVRADDGCSRKHSPRLASPAARP